MKHHLKRQLRRLATERPYQIVAGSAAALVLASSGVVLATTDDTPVRQETAAAVAELAPRTDGAVTRNQARIAGSPSTSPSATSAKPDPDLTRAAKPKPPSTKVLDYTYQAQISYWNCGPAAVRNALSATGIERTQDELVVPLRATENGTNSAEDTTRGLNQMVKGSPYKTRMIPGAPTSAQIDQLQADIVNAVTDGRAVVANTVGTGVDTDGGWHSFPGGHYIAVVGYKDNGRTVRIADSANPATAAYWKTTADLANWMATRGYSA
ncbi:C39 family peptidase [Micromonospora cremea]|uniref:Peptidase_C39 like family protein n=1 Tax=Micromonospora cremea TaxID=709881 RepID=A0A1N5TCJ2_9ACTN|nr:C39 family peptidase [Micromonospora cremea]SIM46001.1 Peptidase_C39 like family protein [Micromonospora cremea]